MILKGVVDMNYLVIQWWW